MLGQTAAGASRQSLLLQGWLWLVLMALLLAIGMTAILLLSLLWRRGLRRERRLAEARLLRRQARDEADGADDEDDDIWRASARRVPLDERPDRERRPPRSSGGAAAAWSFGDDDEDPEDDEDDDDGPPDDPYALFGGGDPLGAPPETDGFEFGEEDGEDEDDDDFIFDDDADSAGDAGAAGDGFELPEPEDDDFESGSPPPGWDR